MKEIKAYIRAAVADGVIHALERVGARSMTIIPVQAIGDLCDSRHSHLSMDYVKPYSQVFKIELICKDSEVEQLLTVIQKQARTGEKGDGILFVYDVEGAVKVRTGERDDAALDVIHDSA